MNNQNVAHDFRISNELVDSLLRLRTAIAKLSTRALMIERAREGQSVQQITLEEVLELAYVFKDHLDDASRFWEELDFIKKLQG